MPFVEELVVKSESSSNLVQSFLEHTGITLLSEWDMLTFVYRHGPTLTTTDQIARLIGFESAVVAAALNRLESQKLIERVGPPEKARLHRMVVSADVERRWIRQFVSLSETRAGRLLLKRLLTPIRLESHGCDQTAKSAK